MGVKAVAYILGNVERNLREGNITPDNPVSMEWLCIQMIRVIENLMDMCAGEDKVALAGLHSKYYKLLEHFQTLSQNYLKSKVDKVE